MGLSRHLAPELSCLKVVSTDTMLSSTHRDGKGKEMARRPEGITQRKDRRWQGRVQVNSQRVTVYGKTGGETKAKLDSLRRQAVVNGGLAEG